MNLPDFSPRNKDLQWERFCKMMWFSDELGIWLDISRMNLNTDDIELLKPQLKLALTSMQQLEQGGIANKDEKRMVGHYWLRKPSIAPNPNITDSILEQIQQIDSFGKSVLNGKITNEESKTYTDLVWIGIGGSSLGPMLLISSLQKLNKGLKFHFFDNVDPKGIKSKLTKLTELSTTLFVVVSKSGGTPEPKICMDQVRSYVESKGFNWCSRAVAITLLNSQLSMIAEEENWLRVFDLPDWVGGRTSITSAVGLLPLALIDSDIRSFLKGAAAMDSFTRNEDISKNPSALLALAWHIAGGGKGLKDMVVLPYCDSLELFSKYLQQLVMESLGKKKDRKGNLVNQGLAVYGNKGSTDQHAYVQQLRDGIDNFFVTFLEVLNNKNDLPTINGRSPSDYISGFFQGTRLALSDNNRQSISITLKNFDTSSLGSIIALFERAVGIYAELIDINAYDQPGVEAGKIAAADIIQIQSDIHNILSTGKEYNFNELSRNLEEISPESIYFIVRNMSVDIKNYSIKGDWSKPETLRIKYIN